MGDAGGDLVLYKQHGPLVELRINRPAKRNAIHWPLLEALEHRVARAERATDARALVLRGEGSCFSAGLDVSSLFNIAEHFGDGWREDLVPLTRAFQRVASSLERCSLPTIALLHGHVLGLGFELALACDMRIAVEGTRLALPEVKLGLIPDVGGTTRLTRLIGPGRAKELILTGRELTLEEASDWGVVNHRSATVDEGELKAAELVKLIIEAAPLAVRHAKRVIDGLHDLDRGLQLEALAQCELIKTEDFQTGAQSLLIKQTPAWKGK